MKSLGKMIRLSAGLLLAGGTAVGLGSDLRTGETFVPTVTGAMAGATLELRSQATASGSQVTLRQVCRWSEADAPAFLPIADLVVARLSNGPQRSIDLVELRDLLQGAGVNLAVIKFTGSASCTIQHDNSDVIEIPAATATAAAAPAEPARTQATPTPAGETRNLRQILIADLCTRLGLSTDAVQIQFNPQDEKNLLLAEPIVQFNVTPRRVRNLGEVTWDVLLVTPGASQKLTITANARAWQDQLFMVKPVNHRQIITGEDVGERRVLVDRLIDEPLLRAGRPWANWRRWTCGRGWS